MSLCYIYISQIDLDHVSVVPVITHISLRLITTPVAIYLRIRIRYQNACPPSILRKVALLNVALSINCFNAGGCLYMPLSFLKVWCLNIWDGINVSMGYEGMSEMGIINEAPLIEIGHCFISGFNAVCEYDQFCKFNVQIFGMVVTME